MGFCSQVNLLATTVTGNKREGVFRADFGCGDSGERCTLFSPEWFSSESAMGLETFAAGMRTSFFLD